MKKTIKLKLAIYTLSLPITFLSSVVSAQEKNIPDLSSVSQNKSQQDSNSINPTVDLSWLYSRAIAKNPDLRQANLQLKASESSYGQARGVWLPHVNISGQIGQKETKKPISSKARNFHQGSIEITQSIFNLGSFKNIGIAELRKQASQINLIATRNQLLQNVVSYWLEAVALKSKIKSLDEQVKTLSKQVKVASIQFKVGNRSSIEFYQLQGDLANRKYLLSKSQSDLLSKLDQIYILTGEPLNKDQIPFNSSPEALLFIDLQSDWLKRVRENNTNLAIARINQIISQRKFEQARAGFYPNLSLFARYSLAKDEVQIPDQSEELSYGVQVSIPIFNGLSTYSKTKSSGYANDSKIVELEKQTLSAETNVTRLINTITSNLNAIKSLQLYESSQSLNYKSMQKRFYSGQVNITEFIDSYTKWFDAQTSLSDAVYGVINAQLQLKALTNDLTERDLDIIQSSIKENSDSFTVVIPQ